MACPAGHQRASSLSLDGWWPAGEGHGVPAWLLPSLVNSGSYFSVKGTELFLAFMTFEMADSSTGAQLRGGMTSEPLLSQPTSWEGLHTRPGAPTQAPSEFGVPV